LSFDDLFVYLCIEERIKKPILLRTLISMRYEGTNTAIMVKRQIAEDGQLYDYAIEFVRMFQQEYIFKLQNRNIVIGVKNDLAKLQLTSPMCTSKGEKTPLSRR